METKKQIRDQAVAARMVVNVAVMSGFIPRVSTLFCVDCGVKAQAYDHRDYNKPLEIEPVCSRCNMRRGPGDNPFFDSEKNERIKVMKAESKRQLEKMMDFLNLHDLIQRAQIRQGQPLGKTIAYSCKIGEENRSTAEQICERHGITLSAFMRECIYALAEEYGAPVEPLPYP